MVFAIDPLVITAAHRKLSLELGQRTEGILMLHLRFSRENSQSNPLQPRSGAGEVSVNQILVQSDGLEHLRSLIALQGRDAHLRKGFQ